MELIYQNLPELLKEHDPIPEWLLAACHRVLAPNRDKFKFAFNDPNQFSDTPSDPHVFGKLLHHLLNAKDDMENTVLQLLAWFSCHCTKTEWENFYQPILLRRDGHGLSIGLFNQQHNDPRFAVVPFQQPSLSGTKRNGDGFFYPYDDTWEKKYAIVYPKYVDMLDQDFRYWDNTYVEQLFSSFRLSLRKDTLGKEIPMVFDLYYDGHDCIIMDMFDMHGINTWPSHFRRDILEKEFSQIAENDSEYLLSLSDAIRGEYTDSTKIMDEYRNQGYDITSVLFIPADAPYDSPITKIPFTG